jgi:multidrug efflux pump subunit AcrA (membrane-fusion protein)
MQITDIALGVVGAAPNADVARAVQQAQGAQGAQAAQQVQRELQQAQRELQQAQREAQQAQREAQQAQQQAQREAQQAQREAQQAVREVQAELARRAREGQAVVPFPPFPGSGPQIPEGAVIISVAFFVMCAVIAIGVPIVRAIARRMDKRNAVAPVADAETRSRLERIEQAVDAIAVEVERISEGQRFTTKVISELRGLPQPDPAAALAERNSDRSAVPVSRTREAR